MINLNNDKDRYFYLGNCMIGEPINFYTEKIYQPIIKDIFKMGEDDYSRLLTPFIIPIDFFQNIPSDMSVYEATMCDTQLIASLMVSLSYFMKIDIVEYIKNEEDVTEKIENIKIYSVKDKKTNRYRNQLIIKDRLIIDDEKFDELKTLILLICNVRELTKKDLESNKDVEKPINKSKEKLLKGRKENNKYSTEEKRVKLVNVYNYVVHEPPMPDYNRYLNWTIYQLYNTYGNMMKKKNIQFTYDVITNGMGTKDMKIESLADQIIK